jgi:hypothetical protein
MIRHHDLPDAGRVGRRHGMISGSWLLPIIAMVLVILPNFCPCTSILFPHPNKYADTTVGRNNIGRIYNPSSSATNSPASFTSLKASSSESSCWSVRNCLGRTEAESLLNDPEFLPTLEYGDRIVFGRQAAEKEHGGGDNDGDEEVGIMFSDDPRLARTYAEFPLKSLDILLDEAVRHLPTETIDSNDAGAAVNMVDIGSGLGRIVLYSALTRGTNEAGKNHSNNDGNNNNNNPSWNVRGIEISSSLHNRALEFVQTGVEREIFEENTIEKNNGDDRRSFGSRNSLSFQCGSAIDESGRSLLEDAHLVFAYSTAFKATGFDPGVGALILDTEEWSLPLSEACSDGCVVITTDRALNPDLGWRVVERLEVPNPEVLGTTGYIHVLETKLN